MKRQEISIDINRLTVDQLNQIASMLYEYNDLKTCKTVNDRIAFIEGWMSDEQSMEYYKKYCEE